MKIDQILDKIDDNQLFIPAFQREYVWRRENAKNLVASLIRNYPTGTMLTWETNTPPELKGGRQYDPRQGAVKIILDGQQRITTLYMLIRDKIPPYYTEAEIMKDPRGMYVHVGTLELQYYKATVMKNDPYWVNITDIFQRNIRERDLTRKIQEVKGDISREEEDRISDNFRAIENIPDIEFLEQSIPVRASLKEAIDIFYIVNASGVNLTEAELALAQISGYWPTARETFKKKLEELKGQGFEFNLDFVIYCLLGILHNVGSDMTKLHAQENETALKQAWKSIDEDVLDHLVNLLRTHGYIDHTDEINSVYALVPVVVYLHKKGTKNLSQDEVRKIIKWFYYSQIRQRYISQMPQKLDKDIGIVVRAESPFDELLNVIKLERPLEISPDEFVGVGIRNALFSLMRWYFKSRNAVCFTTGVGIRQNMGKKYALEWDHIFPYSLLEKRGYNKNSSVKYALAQEITNRAILTQIANRTKSDKQAAQYLHDVKARFPDALRLQTIPENEELWAIEQYEQFLGARREMLARELNAFLTAITVTPQTEGAVDIRELILEGESNELELKSSLRWSYQSNQVDKRLEGVIMKAVAAFSNAEGGTLIIGVNDDGEVLGLDHDFTSLNGDRDEFELHLRNLLNAAYGKAFISTAVTVQFCEVDERDLCQISVLRGRKPVFTSVVGENGQKMEKFYVRSGNASQELGPSETHEYIATRFTE